MWPFSSKYTLEESGLLNGATDWHCHLLPGVDDGVPNIKETLAILNEYGRLGFSDVWFTSHIMEDVPNAPADLKAKFEDVKKAYRGPVKIHLAAENMLDNLFDKRLEDNELLPIGLAGNHLLIETSYFTPPYDLYDKIDRVKSAGYFPLLAHPERYVYMDMRDYDKLKALEIKFQLNIYSLVGLYGPEVQKKARKLLSKDYYNAFGTDTHRHRQLMVALEQEALTKSDIKAVESIKERCAI